MDRKSVAGHCKKLGVMFRGKPLGDMGIRALQVVAPFATNASVWHAFKEFDELSNILNDQSNIAGICNAVNKYSPKGETAFGNCAEILELLRSARTSDLTRT